jgi:hypothetical protein
MSEPESDLVILVPDKNLESTISGLLSRTQSLQILPLRFKTHIHIERDPGCCHRGHDFLRAMVGRYKHGLILFDRHGCGQDELSREALEKAVEDRLNSSGWENRARCIVIDPELEIWVWADSPHVANSLGWSDRQSLRDWLNQQDLWPSGAIKPPDPKLAVERALREVRKPRSSSIYEGLARSVGLQRCTDSAFLKLREILQTWFGTGRMAGDS